MYLALRGLSHPWSWLPTKFLRSPICSLQIRILRCHCRVVSTKMSWRWLIPCPLREDQGRGQRGRSRGFSGRAVAAPYASRQPSPALLFLSKWQQERLTAALWLNFAESGTLPSWLTQLARRVIVQKALPFIEGLTPFIVCIDRCRRHLDCNYAAHSSCWRRCWALCQGCRLTQPSSVAGRVLRSASASHARVAVPPSWRRLFWGRAA